MKKITLRNLFNLVFIFAISISGITAQVNPWSRIHTGANTKLNKQDSNLGTFDSYTLNEKIALTTFNSISSSGKTFKNLQLPVNENQFSDFKIYKTNVLHPDLAKKYPEILTLVGYAEDGAIAKLSYSPSLGLQAAINNVSGKTYKIKRSQSKDRTRYKGTSGGYANSSLNPFECEMESSLNARVAAFQQKSVLSLNDGNIRKYRLAVSTTGAYSQYFLDGTEVDDVERKAKVLAAITASITRINGIFERDFGVTMELVAANDAVIFLNTDTDPYSFSGEFNTELQQTLDSNREIGSSNYDVGHLFDYQIGGKRGNAGCIACVCTNGQKGSGYSIHGDPTSDDFNLLAAHEFGHQFGAYHTQSSNTCRSGVNSEVEPGSGSTIMSYAGICPPNIQEYADDYFNYVDIRDVLEWTINGSSCATLIPTANTVPTADAGSNYTIPKSTPFVLEGTGMDQDNDMLTYCWEQNNPEDPFSTNTPQSNWQFGPLFRSRLPSNTSKRYMPQLEDVLSGNLAPTWEVLPSVSRDMNFVLTVRDNVPTGGQTASDEMIITVTDTAGPFTVTSQETATIWNVGEEVTVTWDVANTDQSPINAQAVDIYASVDGGLTYPHLLLENSSNDGSETFALPYVASSSEVRVMVRGHDNIFFAVNATNFEIQASEFVMQIEDTNKSICQSSNAIYNFTYLTYLDFAENVIFSIENLPDGVTADFSPASISGIHLEGTPVVVTLSGTENAPNGHYELLIKGNSASIEKKNQITVAIFGDVITPPVLLAPFNEESSISPSYKFEWLEDSNVKTYTIEIAQESLFTNKIETSVTSTNTYISKNLEGDSQYFWRIVANNPCGISGTSEVRSFTTACINPTNFVLNFVSQTQAELDWNPNESSLWELEYGPIGFIPGNGTVVTVNEHPYTLTGLTSNTEYDIYLRATCNIGVVGGNNNLLPIRTTINYCTEGRFFDSGGLDGGYANQENIRTVISPDDPGQRVRVRFQSFILESGYDYLSIFDGPNENSPRLFYGSGNTLPGTYISSHESGALAFVFTSDDSVTEQGWDAVVFCEPKPNCNTPTTISSNNSTPNTINLSWVDDESSSWEIEYGVTGFIEGEGTKVITTTNPHEISELASNTTYDIYIKSICQAGGYSDVVGPVTVSTPCDIYAAPFYENFAATVTADCWMESGSESWIYRGYADGAFNAIDRTPGGGTNFAYIDSSFPNGAAQISSFQTPLISISNLTTPSVQFSVYSHNASEDSYNTLNVAFYDGANWNTLIDMQGDTIGWRDFVFDISEYTITGPIQLEWTVTENNPLNSIHNDILIDEIKVEEMPSCPTPYGLIASEINGKSIALSWSSQGMESNWELQYGLEGFTPINALTKLATTNPYTLTELLPETSYDIYIRSACGIGDSSRFIGPLKITTECDAFTAPYHQGFNLYNIPNCWKNEGQKEWDYTFSYYDGGLQQYIGDHTPFGNTNFASVRSENYSGIEQVNTLYTPKVIVENITKPSIQFALYSSSSESNIYNTLLVEFYDGASWNELLSLQEATDGWRDYYFDLSAYTITDAVQVRFKYIEDAAFTSERNDILIDDVKIDELSGCRNPYDLQADNITATQATLSWISQGTESNWEIEYGLQGFGVGSGTVVTATTNPYILEGLSELTTYDVYLRAVCELGEYSDYIGPYRLTTPCGTISAPYIENFIYSNIPECWAEVGPIGYWNFYGGLYDNVENKTINDHTPGGNTRYANVNTSTFSSGEQRTLNTRLVTIETLINPSVQFSLYSTASLDDTYNTLVVELYDGSSWNQLMSLEDNTNGWREYYFDLSEYTITGAIQLRFVVTDNRTTNTQNILVDDVVFGELPSCFNPKNLSATDITRSDASIQWEASGPETLWDIAYGVAGFVIDNGTQETVSSTSKIIEGLLSGTEYQVYVRANCGNDDYSEWLDPVSFTTLTNYCGGDHFYDTGGVNGRYQNNENVTTVIAPENTGDRVQVTFNEFNLESCCDYLTIYDGPDNLSPFLGAYNGTSSPGTVTSSHPTGMLTFVFTSDSSVIYSGWDATVLCEPMPSCFAPPLDEFSISNVTGTEVTVVWNTFSTAVNWEIEYERSGFEVGTGIKTATINTNSFVLQDLIAAQRYDVYFRTVCEDGEFSNSVGPISIITPCEGIVAPFEEVFATAQIPNCWTVQGSSIWYYDDALANYDSDAVDHTSGGNTSYAWIYGNDILSTVEPVVLESPIINVTDLSNIMVEFAIFSKNPSGVDTNDMLVEYYDGVSWKELLEVNDVNSITWNVYSYELDTANVDSFKLRFVVSADISDNTTAYEHYFIVDDVKIFEAPTLSNNNISEQEGFNFYPNPVKNILNINSKTILEKITIKNMLGQIVIVQKTNQQKVMVDFETLPAGAYFVNVENVNGASHTSRIIKK